MPDQAIHKVIITGTGRAGTTFLMQLLTAIGLVHRGRSATPYRLRGLPV